MKTKKNSIIKYALSLLSDHFLTIVVAVLLNNAMSSFSKSGVSLIPRLISLIVYFLACYVDSWKTGCSDGSRVRLGTLKKNYFRGFLAGLVAMAPGFLFAFCAFLAETGTASFYQLFSGVDIFTALSRFWNMPLSLFLSYANEIPFLNFVFLLFLPIVAGIGYVLGMHEIALRNFFLYKKTDEDSEDY